MLGTAHDQSVVRMALALMCANPSAPLSTAERTRLLERLQVVTDAGQCVPFTVRELAELRAPMTDYIATYHPRIREIVCRQFPGTTEVA